LSYATNLTHIVGTSSGVLFFQWNILC